MKFTMIENLNKSKSFNYELTDEHRYARLQDLFEQQKDKAYIVRMFYTNKKSNFGDNEVVVTDEFMINLPKHQTQTVEKIKKSDEYRKLIDDGKLAFVIYEYDYGKGKGKKAYSVNWVQIQ